MINIAQSVIAIAQSVNAWTLNVAYHTHCACLGKTEHRIGYDFTYGISLIELHISRYLATGSGNENAILDADNGHLR